MKIQRIIVYVLIAFLVGLFLVSYLNQQSRKSKAVGETAAVTFNPQSVSASAGQDLTVTVVFRPSADIRLRGYDLKLYILDKSILQVKDIQYRLGVVSAGLGDDNSTLAKVNQTGIINLQGETQSAQGQVIRSSTGSDIATITLTSITGQLSQVTGNLAISFFYTINPDYSIGQMPVNNLTPLVVNPPTISANPSLTIVPSVISVSLTPTPTPPVFLNLRLKFQGILTQPNRVEDTTMNVSMIFSNPALSVYQRSSANCVYDPVVSLTDPGIWNCTSGGYVPNSSGYSIFVKGPKHIQRKVCDQLPTEASAGLYHCTPTSSQIDLTGSSVSLDFSKIPFLVGDLPLQDGIVNSYDISLIRNNLGVSDPAVLSVADLNLDGIVDTQDYSLAIAALSVRTDEEQ